MNILFYQNLLDPSKGGVTRVTNILISELQKKNYNCFVCNYFEDDYKEYPSDCICNLSGNISNSEKQQIFNDFILKNNIDIIINQTARSNNHFSLFKQAKKINPTIKVYSTLHVSPDYCKMNYTIDSPINRFTFKMHFKYFLVKILVAFYNYRYYQVRKMFDLSDKLILTSARFYNSFKEIYNVKNTYSKLIAIPNPLTFTDYISSDQLLQKKKVVLLVSRLVEGQKRILKVLEIWNLLKNKDGFSDWTLKIVGTGPHQIMYQNMAKFYNLDNIIFEGAQSNVKQYYEEASIFMMTSIWEAWGMTLTESLQNGCIPIVFDNFLAVHDIIEDNKNGFIIPNNDCNLFAERIAQLMNDSELRIQLGNAGIQKVKEFEAKKVSDIWITYFENEKNSHS